MKMKKKPILALIPARAGSKGIPRKNIKELAGRPLIDYTIQAARQAASVSRVVVSTDSREIAEIATACGAEVPFLRPAQLASDTASTMEVVMHTLHKLAQNGENYEYLVLLQPTSPLRTAEDIEACIQKAFACGEDVVAISEVSDSPILMRTCEESGKLSALLEGTSTVRRQDMPVYYRVNGSIYVNKVDGLSVSTSLNDNPVGYILPKEHSVDIDEPADFALAEFYLRGALKK
jgi:CMP-N-acetylneuraminic acid synthetase